MTVGWNRTVGGLPSIVLEAKIAGRGEECCEGGRRREP
jgi:hypothetical protein